MELEKLSSDPKGGPPKAPLSMEPPVGAVVNLRLASKEKNIARGRSLSARAPGHHTHAGRNRATKLHRRWDNGGYQNGSERESDPPEIGSMMSVAVGAGDEADDFAVIGGQKGSPR